jgi:hypothetical protein
MSTAERILPEMQEPKMKDVPVEVDAGSFYDTLSERDKEALRQVADISERLRKRLFAREGVKDVGEDDPTEEEWDELQEKMMELKPHHRAVLFRLTVLAQRESDIILPDEVYDDLTEDDIDKAFGRRPGEK